jgi:hypothetical protein
MAALSRYGRAEVADSGAPCPRRAHDGRAQDGRLTSTGWLRLEVEAGVGYASLVAATAASVALCTPWEDGATLVARRAGVDAVPTLTRAGPPQLVRAENSFERTTRSSGQILRRRRLPPTRRLPLPAVVSEGLVGLGHAVDVVLALVRAALLLLGVEKLVGEALGHRLFAPLAGE